MRASLARATWVLTVLLPASVVSPAGAPRVEPESSASAALVFDEPHRGFGDRYQHEQLRESFRFTNRGARPVTIEPEIQGSGSAKLEIVPNPVPPGAAGEVRVLQPVGDALGRLSFRYVVQTDEPGAGRYRLSLDGFVQSAYDPERVRLSFGDVERTDGGHVELDLFSREVPRLTFEGARGAPPWLVIEEVARAGVAAEGIRLRATVLPGAPEGYRTGGLRLMTNVRHQPELTIEFRASVRGDVLPSENPIDLGLIRAGTPVDRRVRLESRSGRAIDIARVEDPAGRFEIGWSPCADAAARASLPSCSELRLETVASQTFDLTGELFVHLRGQREPITLRYAGMVAPEGVRVKKVLIGPDGAVQSELPR